MERTNYVFMRAYFLQVMHYNDRLKNVSTETILKGIIMQSSNTSAVKHNSFFQSHPTKNNPPTKKREKIPSTTASIALKNISHDSTTPQLSRLFIDMAMCSALSIQDIQLIPENTDAIPEKDDELLFNFGTFNDWSYLIPTISVMILGALFVPHFATGLLAGLISMPVNLIIGCILVIFFAARDESTSESEHSEFLKNQSLYCSLIGPVGEELVFRGLIQQLLILALTWLFPMAANSILLFPGINIIAALSILLSSIIFGAAHAQNRHNNAHLQAVSTSITGVFLGLLAFHFGLGASIAAHILIGTILTTLHNVGRCISFKDEDESEEKNSAVLLSALASPA